MGVFKDFAKGARDSEGRPAIKAFRSDAVIDRQIDELIGMAKGVVADGNVNHTEAEFVLRWLETNRAASAVWPAAVLYPRLAAILYDGRIDDDEERELLEPMLSCTGANGPVRGESSMSTDLPYTKPLTAIEIANRAFCFTGKFYSGTRQWCEAQILDRAGKLASVRGGPVC
jgi:hypothetical protein